MHQVQLSDEVCERAKRRADQAGFKSVDEFIANVVLEREAEDAGNYNHRFTPKVLAELDRVSAKAKAGGRTYTQEEVANTSARSPRHGENRTEADARLYARST
jgi:hypothetical protein